MTERDHLEPMITALAASPLALERPVCRGCLGDWQITGKLGHGMADGNGFLLYVSTEESPRRWTNVKARLAGFCRLTQNGDDEGCLHLDRLPTKAEAELIREALGIRKRRHLTEEGKAQALAALAIARDHANRASNGPAIYQNDQAATPARCACTGDSCTCEAPHSEQIKTDMAAIVAAALHSLDEGTDVRIQLDDGTTFATHLKHAELEAIDRHPSIHRVA